MKARGLFPIPPRAVFLLPWEFGEDFAESGDEHFDSLLELLVGGAGLVCKLLYAGFEPPVCGARLLVGFAELYQSGADFVKLALCAAPEGLVFLEVFAAFLGDSGGEVFDAFEPFFCGHWAAVFLLGEASLAAILSPPYGLRVGSAGELRRDSCREFTRDFPPYIAAT